MADSDSKDKTPQEWDQDEEESCREAETEGSPEAWAVADRALSRYRIPGELFGRPFFYELRQLAVDGCEDLSEYAYAIYKDRVRRGDYSAPHQDAADFIKNVWCRRIGASNICPPASLRTLLREAPDGIDVAAVLAAAIPESNCAYTAMDIWTCIQRFGGRFDTFLYHAAPVCLAPRSDRWFKPTFSRGDADAALGTADGTPGDRELRGLLRNGINPAGGHAFTLSYWVNETENGVTKQSATHTKIMFDGLLYAFDEPNSYTFQTVLEAIDFVCTRSGANTGSLISEVANCHAFRREIWPQPPRLPAPRLRAPDPEPAPATLTRQDVTACVEAAVGPLALQLENVTRLLAALLERADPGQEALHADVDVVCQ
jgi:hypothetical protein